MFYLNALVHTPFRPWNSVYKPTFSWDSLKLDSWCLVEPPNSKYNAIVSYQQYKRRRPRVTVICYHPPLFISAFCFVGQFIMAHKSFWDDAKVDIRWLIASAVDFDSSSDALHNSHILCLLTLQNPSTSTCVKHISSSVVCSQCKYIYDSRKSYCSRCFVETYLVTPIECSPTLY